MRVGEERKSGENRRDFSFSRIFLSWPWTGEGEGRRKCICHGPGYQNSKEGETDKNASILVPKSFAKTFSGIRRYFFTDLSKDFLANEQGEKPFLDLATSA